MNNWESCPGILIEPFQKCSKKNENGIQKPKRKKCAVKEKERNLAINDAFKLLQEKIPHVDKERAPKIKILRLAKLYIAELMEALNSVNFQFFKKATLNFFFSKYRVQKKQFWKHFCQKLSKKCKSKIATLNELRMKSTTVFRQFQNRQVQQLIKVTVLFLLELHLQVFQLLP